IRNNTMVECGQSVLLTGAAHHVLVVGNRITGARYAAIDVLDPLAGAAAILVANNTMVGNNRSLRVWDDHGKEKEFLKCKNIRFLNNLVLTPPRYIDMSF